MENRILKNLKTEFTKRARNFTPGYFEENKQKTNLKIYICTLHIYCSIILNSQVNETT